jgi:hypothetical protein
MRKLAVLGIALAGATLPALAVEGALGRTLPGVWIQPRAGVVGPSAGFSFTMMPIGYRGTIGGSRRVPVAGSIVANVEANINANLLVPQYVYKTETPKVTFASAFLGAVGWLGATGAFQSTNFSQTVHASNTGFGDVVLIPLTAGIHFSENNNLAISTMIFAPSAQFTPGSLSNLGMGEWTFMPNFAHTYLWKKRGLEFDNFVGFDIYSKNAETKYTSGTMFHWDGMVIQYLSKQVGFGAIGSNLTQITNDRGPAADLVQGYEGRASGVGPMALYVAKLEKPGVILQLRWINEFKVTHLLKGNLFMFGITLKLN